MDAMLGMAKEFFLRAPWPAAAVIIAFLLIKFGDPLVTKVISLFSTKYVKREDCHIHVDNLKKEITDQIAEMREEVRKDFEGIRDMFFRHLEGNQK